MKIRKKTQGLDDALRRWLGGLMRLQKLVILSSIILFGCGTVRTFNKLDQPVGQKLRASIGSLIFRTNKQSDLPNVVGGRDIYGGKVDRGYTELRLKGIKNNILTLQVVDLSRYSSETTMDRYGNKPITRVENSISLGGEIKPESTTIEFDLSKERVFSVGGVEVTFVGLNAYAVEFILNQQY